MFLILDSLVEMELVVRPKNIIFLLVFNNTGWFVIIGKIQFTSIAVKAANSVTKTITLPRACNLLSVCGATNHHAFHVNCQSYTTTTVDLMATNKNNDTTANISTIYYIITAY